MDATREQIVAALRDFLISAPPVLSPDGRYMCSMDGRPTVLDVVAAHDALARLEHESITHTGA